MVCSGWCSGSPCFLLVLFFRFLVSWALSGSIHYMVILLKKAWSHNSIFKMLIKSNIFISLASTKLDEVTFWVSPEFVRAAVARPWGPTTLLQKALFTSSHSSDQFVNCCTIDMFMLSSCWVLQLHQCIEFNGIRWRKAGTTFRKFGPHFLRLNPQIPSRHVKWSHPSGPGGQERMAVCYLEYECVMRSCFPEKKCF